MAAVTVSGALPATWAWRGRVAPPPAPSLSPIGQEPALRRVPHPGRPVRRRLHPAPRDQHAVSGAHGPLPVRALQAPARQAFHHPAGCGHQGAEREWAPGAASPSLSPHVLTLAALQDGQVVRMSFSNLFKEFKSTATWLQFPLICGAGAATKGDMRTGHGQATGSGRGGPRRLQPAGWSADTQGLTAAALCRGDQGRRL